jgi:hypothetical protein
MPVLLQMLWLPCVELLLEFLLLGCGCCSVLPASLADSLLLQIWLNT